MRKLLPLLFALLSQTVLGQQPAPIHDSVAIKKDTVQDRPWAALHAIQAKLDAVFEEDQGGRNKLNDLNAKGTPRQVDSLWKIILKHDSINLIKVKDVLDHYGWLGTDDIGEKANLTLFLVIQHANMKTQQAYLPMMRQAVKDGKADAANLVLLEDRVLTNQGKPQIYGSQVRTAKNGKYEFFPIADEINVNKRRAALGLDPLEVYARGFGIDYHLPKQ